MSYFTARRQTRSKCRYYDECRMAKWLPFINNTQLHEATGTNHHSADALNWNDLPLNFNER
jgi:hypothetical protein